MSDLTDAIKLGNKLLDERDALRAELAQVKAERERLSLDIEIMQSTHVNPDTCPLWYDGCNCRRGIEDILPLEQQLAAAQAEIERLNTKPTAGWLCIDCGRSPGEGERLRALLGEARTRLHAFHDTDLIASIDAALGGGE